MGVIRSKEAVCLAAVLTLFTPFAVVAQGHTFHNLDLISIPDSGPATPYPSTITVSGVGTLLDVNVHLLGVVHSFPGDIDMLLVGPSGQAVLLMSDALGPYPLGNVDITFDDEATSALPKSGQLPGVGSPGYSPTFRPADYQFSPAPGLPHTVDRFPMVESLGPWSTNLASFYGTDANGTWSLNVVDDYPEDFGYIQGWGLTFETTTIPEPSSILLLLTGLLLLPGRHVALQKDSRTNVL